MWSEFGEDDLRDLDEDLRRAFRAGAVPEPARVAYDKQVLTHDRRREWIAQKHPYVAELASLHDVEYIDLPTGHWPQFTRPAELARAILTAVDRT